jgi:colicin import membrane protein
MKKLLLLLAILVIHPAWSQNDSADDVERARIAAERKQVDAAFQGEEKACYGKFAVNDCLKDARSKRRAALADLRRQEISLNDAQRKRAAAERLRSIEEGAREQKPGGVEHRAKAADAQRSRVERAAEKASDRASSEVSRPAKAVERQEQVRRREAELKEAREQRDKDAAENVKRQEKRLADAQARKANLDKRLADRKKPDAKPLPATP